MEFLIDQVSRHDPECTEVVRSCRNATADELIRLVEAMKRNPHVREINFFEATRSDALFRALVDLFRVNTVIQLVQLPHGTSNEQLRRIEESLRDNETVMSLILFNCSIIGRTGGEIIGTLLSNGTIKEIDLHRNRGFGANGVACMAQTLQSDSCRLKKLCLWDCRIGNDGARELSNALGNNNVLVVLDIASNGITFTGFHHVMEMLETNSFLRVLHLWGNNLVKNRTGHETVGDTVSRALQLNISLQELNIGNCGLSAADASSVLRTLACDNHTLARLRITGNKMDEDSMKQFACSLPEMLGLEEIDFSGYCGVLETVFRGFLEGLRNNKSLVCIKNGLAHNVRGKGSKALWHTWSTFVTRRNRMRPLLEGNGEAPGGGRRAARPAQPVPASLWPSVLEWCKDGQNGSTEANASLIHHVLCTRANDILGSATMTPKRHALEV